MEENKDVISWKILGVVGVIVVGLVLGIVYIEFIQPNSEVDTSQATSDKSQESGEIEKTTSEERSESTWFNQEVYYKQDSNYEKLPQLSNPGEDFFSYNELLSKHRYGVDRDGDGAIGGGEVEYGFSIPEGWIVENTSGKFSPYQNKVLFRLYGNSGIWGAITILDLSDVTVENEREFARFYSRKKSFLRNLFMDVDLSDITKEMHVLRGLGLTTKFSYYETYSTVKTPKNKYANLSYYRMNLDLGFVLEIFIPIEEVNFKTRFLAYMMGTTYFWSNYAGFYPLEKLHPVEVEKSKS